MFGGDDDLVQSQWPSFIESSVPVNLILANPKDRLGRASEGTRTMATTRAAVFFSLCESKLGRVTHLTCASGVIGGCTKE